MGHAERIIAEIATLNAAEQANLLAYVEKLKAERVTAKAPNLPLRRLSTERRWPPSCRRSVFRSRATSLTGKKPMPGKAFLDSNTLIYAVRDDVARRAIADALIVNDAVVSAQVPAETAARHATR